VAPTRDKMTRRPSICSGCFLLGFSPISPAFHSPIVIHWLPLPGNRSRFSPFFSADPTSLEIDFLAATFVWLSVFSYKEQLVVGFPALLHFFFWRALQVQRRTIVGGNFCPGKLRKAY